MRLIFALPLTLLAACGGTPALRTAMPGAVASEVALPASPVVADTCGAQRHGSLRGQDATALERTLILGPVQVLRPGSIAAQDFQQDRVNFIIGPNGTITDITCG
ncbi:MAG: hypothetical protein KJ834_04345 [Alphaproteobacteria bacterium]|nr:hypothetical protein [Alphaproteobacteria bacterium]